MPQFNSVTVGKLLDAVTLLVKSKKTELTMKDGQLDVAAFNRLPEVAGVIKSFREMGVDREWLIDHGFVVASMLLKI